VEQTYLTVDMRYLGSDYEIKS